MPWQWRSLLNSPNKSQDQDQYVDAQNSGSIRKVSILVQEQQASDPEKKKFGSKSRRLTISWACIT